MSLEKKIKSEALNEAQKSISGYQFGIGLDISLASAYSSGLGPGIFNIHMCNPEASSSHVYYSSTRLKFHLSVSMPPQPKQDQPNLIRKDSCRNLFSKRTMPPSLNSSAPCFLMAMMSKFLAWMRHPKAKATKQKIGAYMPHTILGMAFGP